MNSGDIIFEFQQVLLEMFKNGFAELGLPNGRPPASKSGLATNRSQAAGKRRPPCAEAIRSGAGRV